MVVGRHNGKRRRVCASASSHHHFRISSALSSFDTPHNALDNGPLKHPLYIILPTPGTRSERTVMRQILRDETRSVTDDALVLDGGL